MPTILVCLFLLTLLAAVASVWLGRRLRTRSGLPIHSHVVYSDTGLWKKVDKPLFSPRYSLTGKPDYIIEQKGIRIPVEVKPNRTAGEPYLSDSMQLAAYGLLLEQTFGAWPSYGLLKYRNSVFRVEFTEQARRELLEVLEEMQRDVNAEDVPRSHADGRRCHACGYRFECGQNLNLS